MKKLYFVDSIYIDSVPTENHEGEVMEPEVAVSLIALGDDERERENEDNAPIMVTLQRSQLQYDTRGRNIREGWYVFYNDTPTEGKLYFSYANNIDLAQEQIRLNNTLRAQLLAASNGFTDILSNDDLNRLLCKSEVRSYHVNVGHGNCCLILIKNDTGNHIWMIDCSIHEKQNKMVRYANYQAALDACLQQVSHDANMEVQQLHIERFFLTHMHYDHYNGLKYLIDRGYVNQNTICYINLKYQMASKNLNAILQRMVNKGINKIVEPLTTNSNTAIQILYPEKPICRSRKSAIGACRFEKKVNNSSSVIRFNLGNHTMVCPGDLEQEGLNTMSAYLPYPPFCFSDIYNVSHHGSLNGHPIYTSSLVPPFLCKGRCAPWYILVMGRDGAYSGIFSPIVISDFNTYSRLYSTDNTDKGKPMTYMVIDWLSGQISKV